MIANIQIECWMPFLQNPRVMMPEEKVRRKNDKRAAERDEVTSKQKRRKKSTEKCAYLEPLEARKNT